MIITINDSYSQYPTEDKKYECRTGPFEGFFVSSVEFCESIKFDKDDDRKDDRDRDNKTGAQGPPRSNRSTRSTRYRMEHNGTRWSTMEHNGTDGRPGENGTEIDTCVGCLLDALAKLDSGAVLVNVTVDLPDHRPIHYTSHHQKALLYH